MARLIDADELKDKFIFFRKMWSNTEIFIAIDEAPTVDAVEVVRCKDCIHWDKDFLWCDRKWGRTADDDFCSYGERRTNEID